MSVVTQCQCYFWNYEGVCAEQKQKQKHTFVITTFNYPLGPLAAIRCGLVSITFFQSSMSLLNYFRLK